MKLRRASAAFGFRFVHGAVCSKTVSNSHELTNLSVILYFAWAGLYLWSSDDSALRILLALFFGLLVYVLSQTIFKVPLVPQRATRARQA